MKPQLARLRLNDDHRHDDHHHLPGALCPSLTLIGILISLALVVSGCVPYAAVLSPTSPSPDPAATVTPRQHSVSILAANFDPPLDGRVPSIDEEALLVWLRNEGLSSEDNVAVTARLLDPASGGLGELYSDTIHAGALRPGEIRPVRFVTANSVPVVLERYQLVVEVHPSPNQEFAGDSRTYDIVVNRGN
jgi:hypothetical protein